MVRGKDQGEFVRVIICREAHDMIGRPRMCSKDA